MPTPVIDLAMQRGVYDFHRKGRVYLHGFLERTMQFDIFESSTVDLESLPDGVYWVNVSYNGINPIPAFLFIWKNVGRTSEPVGLVVHSNDIESISYATQKLEEKAQFL